MKPTYAWLWQLLPDRCECDGCCRQGIRGNENRISGKIVCDYCHWQQIAEEAKLEEYIIENG